MLNNIYKRIHNKYLPLFKFIFFLRHLFGIFFISATIFLLIPQFFDLKKNDTTFKKYLFKSYGLKLNSYEYIKYNVLPTPNYEIINASSTLNLNSIKLNTQTIKIYPSLISLYNFNNFKSKKITLDKNKLSLETYELEALIKYIYKLKNKIKFNQLEINIFENNKLLMNLQKINFINYGYNKDVIEGLVFNKKFKISLNKNFNKINLKLLNTGINAILDINKINDDKNLKGILKVEILDSKIKFNFNYDEKVINITNFYFRNKSISFKNKSTITINPFLKINSVYDIENIDLELLKNLSLSKIFDQKNLIKKINSENKIYYKPKKFGGNFIEDYNLNINLTYGRAIYSFNFLISESNFSCKGDLNLIAEYPILLFDCSISTKDKKKLLKAFSINYKIKDEPLNFVVKGSLNILNNKVNFNNIMINKNQQATKQDLEYFKKAFETILFNEDLLGIFELNKIKKFISEIS
jgi:hypothetical protein